MAKISVTVSDELKSGVDKAAEANGRTTSDEVRYALIQHMRFQGGVGSDAYRATWDDLRGEIAKAEDIPPEDIRP